MYKKAILATSVTAILFSGIAQAGWKIDDNHNTVQQKLNINGYLAPTAIHTSDNNFWGSTDDKISGNYMEVGIQGRYDFNPNLSFVTSGIYKGVGESKNAPDIDLAYLEYAYLNQFDHSQSIRIGKIDIPYGLHNTQRDNPFERINTFLAQSLYQESFRDSGFSQTGVELNSETNYGWGNSNFSLGITRSNENNQEINNMHEGISNVADFDSDYSGFIQLKNTNPSEKLVSAISYSFIQYDVKTKNSSFVSSGKASNEKAMYSLQYSATRNLTLTGEIEYNQWDFSDLNSPTINNDYGLGYNVKMDYKINNHWNTFISHGATYNDFGDKDGSDYASTTTFGTPAHQRYTKDVTVGLGYKPASNWLFRFEYSNFEGTSILPKQFKNSDPTNKYWDMVSLQAVYKFSVF